MLEYGGLAQLARAPALQAGGQGFESPNLQNYQFILNNNFVASLSAIYILAESHAPSSCLSKLLI